MKKVLCGLVIAIMMTGNGYALTQEEMDCNWLNKSIKEYVSAAIRVNSYSQQAEKSGDNKQAGKYNEWEHKNMKRGSDIANIYNAICKD
jgi:hypothetical protein